MNKENLYAVTGRLILNPVHHCGELIYPGYLFIANKTACKFCSLFPLTHLSKDKVKKEKFIEKEVRIIFTTQAPQSISERKKNGD